MTMEQLDLNVSPKKSVNLLFLFSRFFFNFLNRSRICPASFNVEFVEFINDAFWSRGCNAIQKRQEGDNESGKEVEKKARTTK